MKTHVTISTNEKGGRRLIVDGVDLSYAALAEGFRVELSEELGQPDQVHLIIAADTLDVDLPDVVISAVRDNRTSA